MERTGRWCRGGKPAAILFLFCVLLPGVSPPACFSGEITLEEIHDISEPARLAAAALGSDSWGIRLLAVEMITDREVLSRVALGDEHPSVRLAAVGHLDDEAVLVSAALGDPYRSVARAALEKIGDPARLEEVALDSRHRPLALAALEKLSGDDFLLRVARRALHLPVRLAALEKVGDRSKLADFALRDEEPLVREAATARLADQEVLSGIAFNRREETAVRLAAVRNLEDPEALERLASGEPLAGLRVAALGRVADRELLARLAREEKNPVVRSAAVELLGDGPLLESVYAVQPAAAARRGADDFLAGRPTLFFNGNDAFVQAENYLRVGGSDFTVELWFRPASLAARQALAGSGNERPPQRGKGLRYDAGVLSFHANNEAHRIALSFPVGVTGRWMHAAATVDRSGKAILYLDGEPVAEADAMPLGDEDVSADRFPVFRLGRRPHSNIWFFEGEIAEVRVWLVARSAAEIRENMSRGLSDEEGLILCWPLDEGLGHRVVDRSETRNEGVVSNGRWR